MRQFCADHTEEELRKKSYTLTEIDKEEKLQRLAAKNGITIEEINFKHVQSNKEIRDARDRLKKAQIEIEQKRQEIELKKQEAKDDMQMMYQLEEYIKEHEELDEYIKRHPDASMELLLQVVELAKIGKLKQGSTYFGGGAASPYLAPSLRRLNAEQSQEDDESKIKKKTR